MKKLKIVWICHFSNNEIQSLLPLNQTRNEMAPWIPNILRGFEDREDIEIYVISPHANLKRLTTFRLRNLEYYFIPFGTPFKHRSWPWYFRLDVYSNFYSFRRIVQIIIKTINPDLINLVGAENAYYSSCIFDYKDKYPILITIQGFISQLKGELQLYPYLKKQIACEEKILRSFKNFCGEQDSSAYISKYNPNHAFYKLYYPVNENLILKYRTKEKKYDCIYFGRLNKFKGTEDFIKVIAEIKKNKPDVTACIIGEGDTKAFSLLAKELNCDNNIEFVGFVKTQEELFQYLKESKVFLAPPYFERLSATIREAMFLKVPIVAYATGGIPHINELDENIYMVKTGDYIAMAQKALILLNDENKRNSLADKAYKFAENEFSLAVNIQRHLDAYKNVIKFHIA